MLLLRLQKSPVSAIPPHQRTLLLYHARVEEVNAQLHHGEDICFRSVREQLARGGACVQAGN